MAPTHLSALGAAASASGASWAIISNVCNVGCSRIGRMIRSHSGQRLCTSVHKALTCGCFCRSIRAGAGVRRRRTTTRSADAKPSQLLCQARHLSSVARAHLCAQPRRLALQLHWGQLLPPQLGLAELRDATAREALLLRMTREESVHLLLEPFKVCVAW